MREYEQINLFDDFDDDEEVVEEYKGYTLTETVDDNDTYTYRIYNDADEMITRWKNTIDALELNIRDYNRSRIHAFFRTEVAKDMNKTTQKNNVKPATVVDYTDDEDDEPVYRMSGTYGASNSRNGKNRNKYSVDNYGWWRGYGDDDDDNDFVSSYAYSYSYKPKAKSTGFLDKLNKSDTLVIHPQDSSTEMLGQIYAGKGWDVLRDGDIDKEELHELLKSHDKIIMLGHGTSGGLINKQGGGCTIGDEDAPYLKDKKLFVIWCNADKYFDHHGIGKGQFITDNVPSEMWESQGAGCGNISRELMLENITYWSKLCADVVDQALSGDVKGAVDHIRKNYLEKYGNHPVTIYNAISTDVHGQKNPLPKYEFKGEPLEKKDYPFAGYNEEEFLADPKPTIR